MSMDPKESQPDSSGKLGDKCGNGLAETTHTQKKSDETYRVKQEQIRQFTEAVDMSSEMVSENIEIKLPKMSTEKTGRRDKPSHRTFESSWRDRNVQSQSRSSSNELTVNTRADGLRGLPVNTRADSLRGISCGQTMNKSRSRAWEDRRKPRRSDQSDWRSAPKEESLEFEDDDIPDDLSDEDLILDAMYPNPEKLLLDMKTSKLAQRDNISNIENKRKRLTSDSKKQRKDPHDIIHSEERTGNKSKFNKSVLLRNLTGKDSKSTLIELTKSEVALKDCIEKSKEDNEYLELFLDILAKAYACDTIPNAMIMLFETLKDNKFFDALVLFLTDLQDSVSDHTDIAKHEKILKNILRIVISQVTRNPTSVPVFARVYTAIRRTINEMKDLEDFDLNEDIQTSFTLFSERKKAAENILKSSETKDKNQPPEDFRIIQVTPGANELRGGVQPFLRANKKEGGYEDLDHYLDVQFRLLREDFVGPLREGISEYIKRHLSKQTDEEQQKMKSDIRIYIAIVHSPVVTEHGFCYQMKLEMTPQLRRTNWSVSKRLIYGSLLCLTDDEFSTFILATVVGRNEDDIKRGLFTIQIDGSITTLDLLHRAFKIAETSAYFESYKHVLSGLQAVKPGEMPFEKYIVNCENKVDKPAYLTAESAYDLRPLAEQHVHLVARRKLPDLDVAKKYGYRTDIEELDKALQKETVPVFRHMSDISKSVKILDTTGWPAKECLHLDESQYKAVQTALTKEFSIIQGPPGTGKTYIGLQIARALLHNRSIWTSNLNEQDSSRPLLIVCYTNHALDQFLEGIYNFFKGDILRVGGRSKSNIMERCNLKRYRYCNARSDTMLRELQLRRIAAKEDMDKHSQDVFLWAKSLELYQSEIIHENYMFHEMSRRFYNNLIYGQRGRKNNKEIISCITGWLGVTAIIGNVKRKCQKENSERKSEQVFVSVEDELTERRNCCAKDENDNITEKERILVEEIRKKTIAFFVKDLFIPYSMKNKKQKRTLEVERDFRRKLRSTIQTKIASPEVMSIEEANRVGDIWRLRYDDRWRLYRMWVRQLCSSIYSKIESKRVDYEAAAERYRDALLEEDKEIMRNASVIGMTTTGAAKYQSILKEIEPKIVIVEEAAEILEAHIVTALSKACEHLILIGDHKQLRPNPSVHKLAVRYNLNISLFERMVENGIQFNTLELQHRMRPEIAQIIRHIYPGLKDHDVVKSYPNVQGISANLFLIHHTEPEETNSDIRSYSNLHEALFVTGLCRYLLLQGYRKEQITVLTTYTGQLMCLRKQMPLEEFEGVKLTVVDNYQGEENDFVLLSLVRSNKDSKIGFLKTDNRVCVALSRAKIGFYAIGNFFQLAENSNLWKNITEDMAEQGCFGDRLKLYCQNHPKDDAIAASEGKDFRKAPNGGCSKKCEARLECGHVCQMFCHVTDTEHRQYLCRKPCQRVICENHKCPDFCYEDCQSCKVLVSKIIPRCGHEQLVECSLSPEKFVCQLLCEALLPCHHKCTQLCGEPHTSQCKVELERILPCDHTISTECYRTKQDVECSSPCQTLLKCGHPCKGTCGKCFRGRVHIPCKQRCNRILVCGHECTDFCNNCPPCKAKCENRCIHSQCKINCGEPCIPCQEPCEWSCEHFQCSKLCSEPCDRPRCNEPCGNLLSCGHHCMGLCGEPCAAFFCRECDIERVTEILFGDEDDPNARFVYLEDCGHNIESKAMDTYMDMKDEEEAVQLKGCPRCKTPIRRCLRYGTVIKDALQQIERVKKQTNQSSYSVASLEKAINETLKSDPEYRKTERYTDIIGPWGCPLPKGFAEKNKERYGRQYMKWRCKKLLLSRLAEYKWKLYTENQIVTMRNQQLFFDSMDDVINEINEKLKIKSVPSKRKNDMMNFFYSLCEYILNERNILSEQEIDDFQREIQRGKAYVRYLAMKQAVAGTPKSAEAVKYFIRLKNILLNPERYTDEVADQAKQEFDSLVELTKIDGLGITEDERLEIIQAMGLTKGHWFKCPNNHIYAIGECGGAMQRGKCPECKEEIGGASHRLTDGNELAPEMDGATFAAYSEEANNMANFDLNDLQ